MVMASNGETVDLYAGLELPPPKKRTPDGAVKTVGSGDASTAGVQVPSTETAEGGSEAQTNKKQRTATAAAAHGEFDVASAIARLKTHMVVDKKFAKACALFCTLMGEKLSPDTRSIFLDALTEMIAAKGPTWSGKREFAELIKLLIAKQDVFPELEKTKFADWQLLAVTHYDLFTDDTFQFARAAKQIKLRLDAAIEDDAEKRPAQLEMLMPLLRTLFSRHGVAWAKPSVESVLNVCTRQRLQFSEPLRGEVDSWTKTIQERRHSSTIARSGGGASDARRNVVELTSENASQAKAKVGRSNHPLFNREA